MGSVKVDSFIYAEKITSISIVLLLVILSKIVNISIILLISIINLPTLIIRARIIIIIAM